MQHPGRGLGTGHGHREPRPSPVWPRGPKQALLPVAPLTPGPHRLSPRRGPTRPTSLPRGLEIPSCSRGETMERPEPLVSGCWRAVEVGCSDPSPSFPASQGLTEEKMGSPYHSDKAPRSPQPPLLAGSGVQGPQRNR